MRKFFANTTDGSQLRWNHINSNIATTNDGEVRIWDTRKENQSSAFITAHVAKISGIDWNPTRQTEFVTVANDRHIKVWDTRNTRNCVNSSLTGYPLWKVRYTPFGHGLVTVAQRSDYQVRLWSLVEGISNIHVFNGHRDVIRSFDFRTFESNHTGSKEFQLLTLSRDQTMRQWALDTDMQMECGYQQTQHPSIDTFTEWMDTSSLSVDVGRTSSQQKSYSRKLIDTPGAPMVNYAQECAMVEKEFEEYVTKEELSASSRACIFRIVIKYQETSQFPALTPNARERHAQSRSIVIRLRVSFPVLYPFNTAPMFDFLPTSDFALSMGLKRELNEKLASTASDRVAQNQMCLSACMKMVIETLKSQFTTATGRTSPPKSPSLHGRSDVVTNRSSSQPIKRPSIRNVPAPPIAFATFSPTGHLIYVNSFSFMRFSSSSRDVPKTYSQFKSAISHGKASATSRNNARPSTKMVAQVAPVTNQPEFLNFFDMISVSEKINSFSASNNF